MRIILDFSAIITPAEVIKKRAIGETYFRDIYYKLNNK